MGAPSCGHCLLGGAHAASARAAINMGLDEPARRGRPLDVDDILFFPKRSAASKKTRAVSSPVVACLNAGAAISSPSHIRELGFGLVLTRSRPQWAHGMLSTTRAACSTSPRMTATQCPVRRRAARWRNFPTCAVTRNVLRAAGPARIRASQRSGRCYSRGLRICADVADAGWRAGRAVSDPIFLDASPTLHAATRRCGRRT